MEYPALVYRCPGAFGRPGGSYDCKGVADEDEAIAAISDGWYETLPEAIEAHDSPKPPTEPYPDVAVVIEEIPLAAPTGTLKLPKKK